MLNEEEMVDYINLYRHDLMNNLQLIHGYAQLNNPEQMNKKLTEVLTEYAKERDLFTLNTNKFILFILFINHHYANIKIDCNVDVAGCNIEKQDKEIYQQAKCLMDYFSTNQKDTMYYWLLEIKYDKIKEQTRFIFSLQLDKISHLNTKEDIELLSWNFPIKIEENNHVIQYSFVVPNEL